MATGERLIEEHDVVALLDPIGKWPKGQEGTVVVDYGEHKLIEISDEQGQMLDLIAASEDRLRLVWQPHRP